MISDAQRTRLTAFVAIPMLLVGVCGLARLNRPLVASLQPGPDVLNVSSGRVIKALSLGYDGLAADIYWTRVVQYYGDKRHAQQQDGAADSNNHFPLLMPLLDITVTLDPQLLVAYKVGAMFLAEPSPKGAGRPDEAVALLRRAITNNPNDWRLWADLGMVYYEDLHNNRAAAWAYLQGSHHPGARDWMKVMAAKIAQDGQTKEISCFLWFDVYTNTSDPNIRKNAMEHLQQLKCGK